MSKYAWLLIETSGRGGQVGLATADQLREASLDPARRHNRDLTRHVRELLDQARLSPGNLTGVMVSVGPGSYTGLRVGVMSAKMLAYALNCSLIAVPTFAVLAEAAPPECQRIVILSDGLQGLVYAQPFARGVEGLQATGELRILPAREWAATLPPDVWLGGPAVKLVEELVPVEQPRIAEALRRPRLEHLFQVGRQQSPLATDEMLKLEPLYLRPSSAEEQALRREAQALQNRQQTA